MTQKIVSTLVIFLWLPLIASSTAAAGDKINVFMSIPPQAYFVKAIGGEKVDATVMVAPEKSPASYEPSPRQMVQLANADIYFAIGVPFESAWLKKFAGTNPGMKIVHTEKDIEKRSMNSKHGHQDMQEGIKDPHIWLSPPLVMLQARCILTGLTALDPESAKVFEKNYKAFIRQLTELDTALLEQFQGISNRRFMVFHPSWGYFADAYGFIQMPIEIEGKAPKAKDVTKLIQSARQSGITVIFAQPQYSNKQAQIIARETGARVVTADPLAEDWAQNLKTVADAISTRMK